jgi:hypothetical protein
MNDTPEPTAPAVEQRFIPVRASSGGITAAGAQIMDRLRAQRYRLGISLAIFLGINFILLGLYLWSRGGQTIHVQVVVQGNEFTAFIDSKRTTIARLDAPPQGGVNLTLGDTEEIPSLPKPRGIDSLRVTDLSNGKVLFQDNFSNGPSSDWAGERQDLTVDHGIVGTRSEAVLSLGERPWKDYVVDMTFTNLSGASIRMRSTTDNSGVEYFFRPLRHYDNGFTLFEQGQAGQYVGGKPIEVNRVETVKSLLAMVLQTYPYIFVFLAMAFLFVIVLQFLGGGLRIPGRIRDSLVDAPWFAAAGLAAFGLVVAAFINYSYSDHMPHVPDELAYLFQAKLLTTFHLSAPVPRVGEVFDYFYPPFIVVQDGHWIGVYPFGHPLLLAFGEMIGAAWLVPAIVGAATVFLVFAIGRKVYSARVGLLAALIFVASPFFLMTASNFMSHNTAAFYLMGSLFCIVISDRRPFTYGIIGGLLYGLFFNTQQLTAVALIAPVGVLLASAAIPKAGRMPAARHIGGFLLGGLIMLGLYFLYNLGTTGDAFTTGLQIGSNPAKFLGFGGENSASQGIQNQQIQLAFLLLVMNGWPLYVGAMFVIMPFVLATRNRWDWFLLTSAIIAMGVYVLFIGAGVMHGPRYWYVASPLLALLTARGADRAAEVLSGGASALRARIGGTGSASQWPGVIVVYAAVFALVGAGIYGWLLGHHTTWADDFVPNKAETLRNFNNVDDRVVQLVEEQHLHHALVLMQDCQSWQCYGSVFWLNNTKLDGDVVFAKDMPKHRAELFAAYPDRYVYVVQYAPPASLSPYGSTGPIVIDNGTPNAPRARDIDVPKPTPTAAPSIPNPEERDQQRTNDLHTIADALQQYYAVHGAYPLAEGLQSFCRYQELDAGCKVTEILAALPRDPDTTRAYYYLSNGTSFVLWVQTDNPAPASDCPSADPRPAIDPAHTYCVQGQPPEP